MSDALPDPERPDASPIGARLSPMLQQYFGVKRQHPDALLFFRMGDFFELFFEDAKLAAKVLGIALTSRSKEHDMPMAGVPVRNVDGYLRKLIQAGHRVVVCDQVEDPKQAKGLVDRQVTRIVTAGTLLEDALLESGRHNYAAALALLPSESGRGPKAAALAWLDLSTARFEATTVPLERLRDELHLLAPAELLLPEPWREQRPAELAFLADSAAGPALTFRPAHEFTPELARKTLCDHFRVGDLVGFGFEPGDAALAPAGALLAYAHSTQRGLVGQITRLARRAEAGTMRLDRAALQALELFETTRERRREGSLLSVADRTRTAAGARLLRDWLAAPLTDVARINARHDGVGELLAADAARAALRAELDGIFDLERIVARLAAFRASPRDLAQLRDTLRRMPRLNDCVAAIAGGAGKPSPLAGLRARIVAPPALLDLLERSIDEAPPLTTKEGGFIKAGFHAELDELRKLRFDVESILADLQRREIERSGIPSLKVGFNSVFGYYLEITHAQRERVPVDYIRKQTLKNAERYITPELKELESRVLSAEERSIALELELFEQVRASAAGQTRELQQLAAALAELDLLQGFAEAAREHGWERPTVEESRRLLIDEGAHPVLRATLAPGAFVANDTRLAESEKAPCFALLTGPNMAGKSTWLRQNALIVLLAQAGSFVPAKRATIGIVDRIFTRVGASDDLARGASTFMVEMAETANVLHHATDRSLVILDEVGRGTGTFDGMSLARALAEHLATKTRCKTLFATHYHQLTQLAEELPAVVNLSVAVREWGDEILFLHRIVAGGTDRSYGLHVARLAGIPAEVIARAKLILAELERLTPQVERSTQIAQVPMGGGDGKAANASAPAADSVGERVARELRRLDVERLTPLQALTKLAEMKWLAQGEAPAAKTKAKPGEGAPSLFGRGAGG